MKHPFGWETKMRTASVETKEQGYWNIDNSCNNSTDETRVNERVIHFFNIFSGLLTAVSVNQDLMSEDRSLLQYMFVCHLVHH